jgi:hypothetical protein
MDFSEEVSLYSKKKKKLSQCTSCPECNCNRCEGRKEPIFVFQVL